VFLAHLHSGTKCSEDALVHPIETGYIVGMTLSQAAQHYHVTGLDQSLLNEQKEAFQTCLTFLEGVEKSNGRHTGSNSYGLKHIVENPSGRFGIPASQDCYNGYIYEGTLILAALASGFTISQRGHLHADLNISERCVRRRAKEFANSVIA